jgi:hypothetical protein
MQVCILELDGETTIRWFAFFYFFHSHYFLSEVLRTLGVVACFACRGILRVRFVLICATLARLFLLFFLLFFSCKLCRDFILYKYGILETLSGDVRV